MQWGELRFAGSDCDATNTGEHHLEERSEGEWCRMCGTMFPMDQLPPTNFVRAGGDVVCGCGKKYYDHPSDMHPTSIGYDGRPVLKKLCGGRRVKL